MLTLRQEDIMVRWDLFCLGIAKGEPAGQAYMNAGYECKDMDVAYSAASRLLRNVKVQDRIKELRESTMSERVADITERYAILTEIARERATTPTGVPLHSPRISAIDIMNKLDKRYTDQTININDIKIQVVYEEENVQGQGSTEDSRQISSPEA